MLCSLGCLRMAGKVFGPECDDAESVLGTRNVLHPHCCKCGQTLDACWPFQQLSQFTSYVTLDGTDKQTNKQTNKLSQVSYMNTVICLALLTLQQLQAGCRSALFKLKVGTFGIWLSPQVHRTHKPCISSTDVILKFFHQSTVYFAFTK